MTTGDGVTPPLPLRDGDGVADSERGADADAELLPVPDTLLNTEALDVAHAEGPPLPVALSQGEKDETKLPLALPLARLDALPAPDALALLEAQADEDGVCVDSALRDVVPDAHIEELADTLPDALSLADGAPLEDTDSVGVALAQRDPLGVRLGEREIEDEAVSEREPQPEGDDDTLPVTEAVADAELDAVGGAVALRERCGERDVEPEPLGVRDALLLPTPLRVGAPDRDTDAQFDAEPDPVGEGEGGGEPVALLPPLALALGLCGALSLAHSVAGALRDGESVGGGEGDGTAVPLGPPPVGDPLGDARGDALALLQPEADSDPSGDALSRGERDVDAQPESLREPVLLGGRVRDASPEKESVGMDARGDALGERDSSGESLLLRVMGGERETLGDCDPLRLPEDERDGVGVGEPVREPLGERE